MLTVQECFWHFLDIFEFFPKFFLSKSGIKSMLKYSYDVGELISERFGRKFEKKNLAHILGT